MISNDDNDDEDEDEDEGDSDDNCSVIIINDPKKILMHLTVFLLPPLLPSIL